MVAICAPIYYHPEHAWCGREWAAMDGLSRRRLENAPFRAIIPIIMRERDNLPEPVAATQYVDFSREAVQGRRFYSTREFRAKMVQVVDRIEQVARVIVGSGMRANCDAFVIPEESAFAATEIKPQQFPFRGGH
jgi:hypothetical protein